MPETMMYNVNKTGLHRDAVKMRVPAEGTVKANG